MAAPIAATPVVVINFDTAIINGDCFELFIAQMGLNDIYRDLFLNKEHLPRVSKMDQLLDHILSTGVTVENVAESLRRIPVPSEIIDTIQWLHGLGVDLKIISNANSFFVETIMEHHGLNECFIDLFTNECTLDQGRMRVFPQHDLGEPHNCIICPPNLCTGFVLDRIKASLGEREIRFIYIGSTRGDFCAGLGLGKWDFLMPRKHSELTDMVWDGFNNIKAVTINWEHAEEFELILKHLVENISLE